MEKILSIHATNRVKSLLSNHSKKKTINPTGEQKRARYLNGQLKEDIQLVDKHMKRYSVPVMREITKR